MPETWQEELRSHGYRVTPQRQLVLEAVTALEHGTPEQICTEVQRTARGVNISTIYRTLELLEELGLVKHAHLKHGPPTYHLAAEAEHVHLMCRECGRVQDVGPEVAAGLVGVLDREYGFVTDVHHLTVYGLCRDCRDA
ncbi:MAG TPA: transcriptional repressor [Streptosporangiaceae bacterium]